MGGPPLRLYCSILNAFCLVVVTQHVDVLAMYNVTWEYCGRCHYGLTVMLWLFSDLAICNQDVIL